MYMYFIGGFLYVDDILQNQRNLQDYSLEDIQRIEKSNDKQRFFMEEDKGTGKMKIRANYSLQVK
jgi:RNA:NAD 2'-phosphotransferase (TPT1/KptA family)